MLINLSNHPLNTWTPKQIAVAEKLYGKIVDLEFPQIPPEADEEIVKRLAEDFKDICLDILSSANDNKNAVHIMGELTFIYNLVFLLKKNNVVCVASTTERKIVQEDDAKTSYFTFVRFREY